MAFDPHALYHRQSPGVCCLYLARDFWDNRTNARFQYQHKNWEKIGRFLRWGVGGTVDFLLRNFDSPAMITAFAIVTIIATLTIYYPALVYEAIVFAFPVAKQMMTPAFLKLTCCILTHITIIGMWLRFIGRTKSPELMQAYRAGHLTPLYVGSRV
jgi:hypothetical protein